MRWAMLTIDDYKHAQAGKLTSRDYSSYEPVIFFINSLRFSFLKTESLNKTEGIFCFSDLVD